MPSAKYSVLMARPRITLKHSESECHERVPESYKDERTYYDMAKKNEETAAGGDENRLFRKYPVEGSSTAG